MLFYFCCVLFSIFLSLFDLQSFAATESKDDSDFVASIERPIAALSIEESEVLEDYTDKIIVRGSDSDDDGDTVSTGIIEGDLKERLESLPMSSPQKVYILRYRESALNDITFDDLTNKLIPLIERRFILDFSFNGITVESISSLKRWLDTELISYVCIDGNPTISKRYIKNLCTEFLTILEGTLDSKKQKIRQYMEKLIFIPQYYISTAKRKVKVYKDLVDRGYLPANWDSFHRKFYEIVDGAAVLDLSTDEYLDPVDEAAFADDLE